MRGRQVATLEKYPFPPIFLSKYRTIFENQHLSITIPRIARQLAPRVLRECQRAAVYFEDRKLSGHSTFLDTSSSAHTLILQVFDNLVVCEARDTIEPSEGVQLWNCF